MSYLDPTFLLSSSVYFWLYFSANGAKDGNVMENGCLHRERQEIEEISNEMVNLAREMEKT